jgi:hypothetical protein
MSVVTELPKYTLRDYIVDLHRQHKSTGHHSLDKRSLKPLLRSLLLVVAGLHAKGLVHLDLQPENFVVIGESLKLIDTDGCTALGKTLSIMDSTLSFSPCYCSPEWARFITGEDTGAEFVTCTTLDIWSLGMIICELVLLTPVMRQMYSCFAHTAHSPEEAGLLFMEWLGCLKHFPMAKAVRAFDADLEDFLLNSMLVIEPVERRSLQQCLTHDYIVGPGESWQKLQEVMPEMVYRDNRGRPEDHYKEIMYRGALWKLNAKGDPMDPAQWLQRDMWMTPNGNMCYFSHKENKRLVLLNAAMIHRSLISDFTSGARAHAFQVCIRAENQGEPDEVHVFACNSADEQFMWTHALQREVDGNTHAIISAGLVSVHELLRFRLEVDNHRKPVDCSAREQFEPFFRGCLWKLKAEGNLKSDSDWFYRDMWLSKNGSLVYWSQREDRELIYHTSAEVRRSSILTLGTNETCKHWAFMLVLPPYGDLDFSPTYFATDSPEQRERWMSAFRNFSHFTESATDQITHQRFRVRKSVDGSNKWKT